MTEKNLREFLNYRSKKDMLSQCKVWILLYSAFVFLFIDVHFYINLDTITGNEMWILINTILTGLIVPLIVVYKKNMNISQIFFFESMIIFGISIQFFYLFLFKCVTGAYILSIIHYVISFVMLFFIVVGLFYRKRQLIRGKKKVNKSPVFWASVSSVGFSFAFCLRIIFKNSEMKNAIIGYTLFTLSLIFLMIACFDFQNFIICKRYKFNG